MRGVTMAILTIVILASVIIPIHGTDADTPARLYFFNTDNECIAEVILIPGEPLDGADIPFIAYKEWYDDDAQKVFAGRAFDSGDYIIRPYDAGNPPTKPSTDNSPDYTVPIIAGAVILVAIGAVACFFIFKK